MQRRHGSFAPAAGCGCQCRRRPTWPPRRRKRVSSGGLQTPWPSPGALTAGSPRRLACIDFWPGFYDDTDRWISIDWFRRNLPGVDVVREHEKPSVILFTLFGRSYQQHARQGCPAKLVFFSGENIRPPLGKVPLCISFDHTPSVPSTVHTRLPLWVFVREVHEVLGMHAARLRGDFDLSAAQRPGFCTFVASNATMYNAKVRNNFVQALSRGYRPVSCGGEVMNNVGGPVKDKMAFLRTARFNVAFENASHPGYCTEKVLHAFSAGCVPIYWGDPNVSAKGIGGGLADFNPAALISAHDFESPELLIGHIEKVDRDPELFASYLRQPIFAEHWYQRLRDWPAFTRGLVDLLFERAEEGTPPLPPATVRS